MKFPKKIVKAFIILAAIAAAGFAFLVIYAVITDYRPDEKTVVEVNDATAPLDDSLAVSLLTWNIGYCGLDSKMDFFYDGGSKVFTSRERFVENLKAVMTFLRSNDSLDFILIQEMDKNSKRSFEVDQFETITGHLQYESKVFGTNYKVFFVPVPPATPMGKVYSGVATLSRFIPSSSVRYSFPGKYGFPKQLFMLDRCFLVNRYPLRSGRELVIVNTHNEAYDPGNIRREQMEYLRNFVLSEYRAGNYIIAGGDWNQAPPGFEPLFAGNKVNTEQMMLPADYPETGWKWIYDSTNPTNRSIDIAYDPGITTTTVIDFFLVSPNVETISAECINLNFEHSDHNPVRIKVRLR